MKIVGAVSSDFSPSVAIKDPKTPKPQNPVRVKIFEACQIEKFKSLQAQVKMAKLQQLKENLSIGGNHKRKARVS